VIDRKGSAVKEQGEQGEEGEDEEEEEEEKAAKRKVRRCQNMPHTSGSVNHRDATTQGPIHTNKLHYTCTHLLLPRNLRLLVSCNLCSNLCSR